MWHQQRSKEDSIDVLIEPMEQKHIHKFLLVQRRHRLRDNQQGCPPYSSSISGGEIASKQQHEPVPTECDVKHESASGVVRSSASSHGKKQTQTLPLGAEEVCDVAARCKKSCRWRPPSAHVNFRRSRRRQRDGGRDATSLKHFTNVGVSFQKRMEKNRCSQSKTRC